MTNIVGDQNRRRAAKSQRKLWDVKSGQFTIVLNGTENCVPKPGISTLENSDDYYRFLVKSLLVPLLSDIYM